MGFYQTCEFCNVTYKGSILCDCYSINCFGILKYLEGRRIEKIELFKHQLGSTLFIKSSLSSSNYYLQICIESEHSYEFSAYELSKEEYESLIEKFDKDEYTKNVSIS